MVLRNASSPRSPWSGFARVAAYVAAWVAAGGVVAVAVVVLAGGSDSPAVRAATVRTAPPVREVELGVAMRGADCEVRRASRRAVAGTEAAPVPAVYRRPVTADERQRAVRAGLVVIEYRHGLTATALAQLIEVQRAVPVGTILAPSAMLQRDALGVTAFGRQLRCRAITARSFDALQLFRGRYLGSGPGRSSG